MKTTRTIFLMMGWLLVSIAAKAQYVSFNHAEIAALKDKISQNTKIKKLFHDIEQKAHAALKDNPNPIVKIRSEGLLMGNPIKTASLRAVEDVDKIYALALVYRISGNKTYLKKAEEFLLAWADTNQATGNPIDETKLGAAFEGYDLIRPLIKEKDKKNIDKWLNAIATAELNTIYAHPDRSTSKNNWNSHRIKVITQIAYTTHQGELENAVIKELENQIQKNLYADGSGFDYAERDALHYHIYDLEPLLKTAITLKRATGKDYFNYQSPTGSSIKKSVDFLVPFVTGEKQHVEFARSKVSFDQQRAKNNEKGYQLKNFVPSTGINVLVLASYFDQKYLLDVKKSPKGEHLLNWQMVVNTIKK